MKMQKEETTADTLADIMEVAVEFNRIVDLDKVYKALENSRPGIREAIQKQLIEALQSTVRVYGGNADVWGGGIDTANQLVRFQRALVAMIRMIEERIDQVVEANDLQPIDDPVAPSSAPQRIH